jgi:uncharacterized protein YodC (DUF2158 family)
MAERFKPGDLVQIKSGGPVMTVKWVSSDGKTVNCQWFSGSKLNEGGFSIDSLVVGQKETKKSSG